MSNPSKTGFFFEASFTPHKELLKTLEDLRRYATNKKMVLHSTPASTTSPFSKIWPKSPIENQIDLFLAYQKTLGFPLEPDFLMIPPTLPGSTEDLLQWCQSVSKTVSQVEDTYFLVHPQFMACYRLHDGTLNVVMRHILSFQFEYTEGGISVSRGHMPVAKLGRIRSHGENISLRFDLEHTKSPRPHRFYPWKNGEYFLISLDEYNALLAGKDQEMIDKGFIPTDDFVYI